jgi:hypothetical protein
MIRTIVAAPAVNAAPTIARHPASQAIAVGGTVVFAVEASANAAAYQWKRNGVALPGAENALFTLTNVAPAHAGIYSVEVANPAGTLTSMPASLEVRVTSDPGRIANFSIRSNAGTGSQTLIVGLAIDGDEAANNQILLIRGVGPTLSSFNVASPLADPKLELFRGSTKLLENDNWDASSNLANLATHVNAFALPADSRDAAIEQSALPRGAYTVQLSSTTPGLTGIALAEIFDATPAGASARQLVNVSARTDVAGGDNTLIAGFVIGGSTARTVLIRAAGPTLSTFGVAGALADPRLTLFRESTELAGSDNWQSSAELVDAFAATGAFNFNARSRDAVLLVTLPPGEYTAQVAGVAAADSGIALVEIYALP